MCRIVRYVVYRAVLVRLVSGGWRHPNTRINKKSRRYMKLVTIFHPFSFIFIINFILKNVRLIHKKIGFENHMFAACINFINVYIHIGTLFWKHYFPKITQLLYIYTCIYLVGEWDMRHIYTNMWDVVICAIWIQTFTLCLCKIQHQHNRHKKSTQHLVMCALRRGKARFVNLKKNWFYVKTTDTPFEIFY